MRLFVVIGTRPEAIKQAPIIRLARANPAFNLTVVSTGQHKEMLKQTCAALDIDIDIELNIMDSCRDLCDIASATIHEMGKIIATHQPDWVVVQGDTSTAASASMAAFYHKCKVAHVEAGLRSFDNNHPFPEEVNRKIIGTLAELHFAPTDNAHMNLIAEGVSSEKIVMTGNTVIDALMAVKERLDTDKELCSDVQAQLPMLDYSRRIVLVTSHRRENHGNGLMNICTAIRSLAVSHPDTQFVFPVHLNPNVQKIVKTMLSNVPNITLTDPLDYFVLVYLMSRSYLILTDSGGIQEEATAFSIPVLVLREKTERMEGVDAGVARLVGANSDDIIHRGRELLSDVKAYSLMSVAARPYGDGQAAQRILDTLMIKENIQCQLQKSVA